MKSSAIKNSGIKSPGIINGILAAFLISLAAGAASLLLGGFIYQSTLFALVLYGVTFAYLIYLLRKSSARVGRVVVISSWAGITLLCWFFNIPLLEQILIQAGIIWLVRSLYFHASLIAAALDFILVAIGLAASTWAMVNTGSLAATVWSFFLVQSLFCWIPDLSRKPSGEVSTAPTAKTNFQSAHRAALDAVQKLTQS